jgi:hypothetical protein
MKITYGSLFGYFIFFGNIVVSSSRRVNIFFASYWYSDRASSDVSCARRLFRDCHDPPGRGEVL